MKVLLAEDDPVSRRLLEITLTRWGYEFVPCSDGTQAWAILQRDDAPQVAILDWMMPGLDGLQVCQRVRVQAREAYTYIILLTARTQREDLIAGMEAGADDYLTKPFDPGELKVRLRAANRVLDLQANLLATREALRVQATHDPLTGLWNRGAILDILRRELARARREAAPLALLLADLDHFKQINDTHGHAAGDAVLREVARRMTATSRPYDSIARFGGEEFLLILPGCNGPEAADVAERIRTRILEEPVDAVEGRICVRASFGVATTAELEDAEADELVRAADTALYRAKNAGRNRTERIVLPSPRRPAPAPQPPSGRRAENADPLAPAHHPMPDVD